MPRAFADADCVAEKLMHMNALKELFKATAATTDHPCGAGKWLTSGSSALGTQYVRREAGLAAALV